jgi:hypothetical protein
MPDKPWSLPPVPGAVKPQSPEASEATERLKKKHSTFFAAVRARGILNHMLDGPAKAYDDNNPGHRSRWEFCPAGGDKTFIVAREGLGFHVVDAKELGDKTDSEQKEGQIRVGDLILMAAPDYVVAAIEMEDARAAFEDFKLPEESYREHIRSIKAKLHDGSYKAAEPAGEIRVHQEEVSAPAGSGLDHQLDSQ